MNYHGESSPLGSWKLVNQQTLIVLFSRHYSNSYQCQSFYELMMIRRKASKERMIWLGIWQGGFW